jgi:hypothetical protein
LAERPAGFEAEMLVDLAGIRTQVLFGLKTG